MATLTELFHTYIADLFPADAEFHDDGAQRLRIIYPIPETTSGQRYSRSIILSFEPHVLHELRLAIADGNVPRQDRIGDATCELVRTRLEAYDVQGPQDTAFQIYIDSRATDL